MCTISSYSFDNTIHPFLNKQLLSDSDVELAVSSFSAYLQYLLIRLLFPTLAFPTTSTFNSFCETYRRDVCANVIVWIVDAPRDRYGAGVGQSIKRRTSKSSASILSWFC